MRVVYEAANLIDAYLVRHALEDAGIPAFVRGEALLGGVGQLPACGLLDVCVADSSWPQARSLVEALPLFVGTRTRPEADPEAGPGCAQPA